MTFRPLHTALLLTLLTLLTPAQLCAQRLYSYIVVGEYPHAEDSYTQGLQIVDGQLYESTGLYGKSRLLKVDLPSGRGETLATLAKSQFGEGITILGDTIYMLTWREGVLHLFDRDTGQSIDTRRYAGEGWGLTSDGQRLYMSNGSNRITVRERESFKSLSSHSLTLNGRPVEWINELEWIEGRIWANIYMSDTIVIINPESCTIEGVVDLTGLLPERLRTPATEQLNGIAYDKEEKKIYVTGKNWSRMYQIELVER